MIKQRGVHCRFIRGVLLVLVVASLNACYKKPDSENATGELRSVPLPVLSGTISLRVGVVDNPRFPELSTPQLQQLLAHTADMVKRQFGISVTFQPPESITIQDFFAFLPPRVKRNRADEIIDINTLDDAGVGRIQDSLTGTLEQYGYDRQQVIDYARPYLAQPPVRWLRAWSRGCATGSRRRPRTAARCWTARHTTSGYGGTASATATCPTMW